jgi:hypothetical protein
MPINRSSIIQFTLLPESTFEKRMMTRRLINQKLWKSTSRSIGPTVYHYRYEKIWQRQPSWIHGKGCPSDTVAFSFHAFWFIHIPYRTSYTSSINSFDSFTYGQILRIVVFSNQTIQWSGLARFSLSVCFPRSRMDSKHLVCRERFLQLFAIAFQIQYWTRPSLTDDANFSTNCLEDHSLWSLREQSQVLQTPWTWIHSSTRRWVQAAVVVCVLRIRSFGLFYRFTSSI